jgi:uncharacterized protein Usg
MKHQLFSWEDADLAPEYISIQNYQRLYNPFDVNVTG